MKIKILFGRPCLGDHRAEVGTLLVEVSGVGFTHPRIADVLHVPVTRVPTSVGRNLLVQTAREEKCGLLFMVDADMYPAPGFFKFAVDFLLAHEGAAVIASPYVKGAPKEDVNVHEWVATATEGAGPSPNVPFNIDCIAREDAARRTGIERVANVGTGYIAYKTECFDKISHPYFDYLYEDETKTKVVETEDCWAHRKLYFAGVPLYVSWDHWSKHRKEYWAEKPYRLSDHNIGGVFLAQARAEWEARMKKEGQGK